MLEFLILGCACALAFTWGYGRGHTRGREEVTAKMKKIWATDPIIVPVGGCACCEGVPMASLPPHFNIASLCFSHRSALEFPNEAK